MACSACVRRSSRVRISDVAASRSAVLDPLSAWSSPAASPISTSRSLWFSATASSYSAFRSSNRVRSITRICSTSSGRPPLGVGTFTRDDRSVDEHALPLPFPLPLPVDSPRAGPDRTVEPADTHRRRSQTGSPQKSNRSITVSGRFRHGLRGSSRRSQQTTRQGRRGIVEPDHHVGERGRVDLRRRSARRRAGSTARSGGGPAGQGGGRELQMHGEVEGQPGAEQQRAADEHHRGRGQIAGRARGRPGRSPASHSRVRMRPEPPGPAGSRTSRRRPASSNQPA